MYFVWSNKERIKSTYEHHFKWDHIRINLVVKKPTVSSSSFHEPDEDVRVCCIKDNLSVLIGRSAGWVSLRLPAACTFSLVENSVIEKGEERREHRRGCVGEKNSMEGEIEKSWEQREGRAERWGRVQGGTGRARRRWEWEQEEGGWLCVSRGPPRELCSREPGHWGEVVRACLKQYTQGFSQSSHTQCARSMSLSQRSPAVHQHIQSNAEKTPVYRYTCMHIDKIKSSTKRTHETYGTLKIQ